MNLKLTRTIAAPPERVFAVSTDIRRCQEFVDGIERTEVLTDGPVGLGTRFRETRVMFGKEATEEMEVVTYEPPHKWAVSAESCGCRYHTEMRYVPDGDGTRIEWEMTSEPLSFVARVMSALMTPLMKGTMVKCLESDLACIDREACKPTE